MTPRNPEFTSKEIDALQEGFNQQTLRDADKKAALMGALIALKNQLEDGLSWGQEIPKVTVVKVNTDSGVTEKPTSVSDKSISAADVQAVINFISNNGAPVRFASTDAEVNRYDVQNYKAILDHLTVYASHEAVPASKTKRKPGDNLVQYNEISSQDMVQLEAHYIIHKNQLDDRDANNNNLLHHIARNSSADAKDAGALFIASVISREIFTNARESKIQLPSLFQKNVFDESPLDCAFKNNNYQFIWAAATAINGKITKLEGILERHDIQANVIMKNDPKQTKMLTERRKFLVGQLEGFKQQQSKLAEWAKINNFDLRGDRSRQALSRMAQLENSKYDSFQKIVTMIQAGDKDVNRLTDYFSKLPKARAAAMLNTRDASGNTILHHLAINAPVIYSKQAKLTASQAKFEDYGGIAGQLINYGALPHLKNNQGQDFIAIACAPRQGKPGFLSDTRIQLSDDDINLKKTGARIDAAAAEANASQPQGYRPSEESVVKVSASAKQAPPVPPPRPTTSKTPPIVPAKPQAASKSQDEILIEKMLKLLGRDRDFNKSDAVSKIAVWHKYAKGFLEKAHKEKNSKQYMEWRLGAMTCYKYILTIQASSLTKDAREIQAIQSIQRQVCNDMRQHRKFVSEFNLAGLVKATDTKLKSSTPSQGTASDMDRVSEPVENKNRFRSR